MLKVLCQTLLNDKTKDRTLVKNRSLVHWSLGVREYVKLGPKPTWPNRGLVRAGAMGGSVPSEIWLQVRRTQPEDSIPQLSWAVTRILKKVQAIWL